MKTFRQYLAESNDTPSLVVYINRGNIDHIECKDQDLSNKLKLDSFRGKLFSDVDSDLSNLVYKLTGKYPEYTIISKELNKKLEHSKAVGNEGYDIKLFPWQNKYKMVPFEKLKVGDMVFQYNKGKNRINAHPFIIETIEDGKKYACSIEDEWSGRYVLTKDTDPMVPAIQNSSTIDDVTNAWYSYIQ